MDVLDSTKIVPKWRWVYHINLVCRVSIESFEVAPKSSRFSPLHSGVSTKIPVMECTADCGNRKQWEGGFDCCVSQRSGCRICLLDAWNKRENVGLMVMNPMVQKKKITLNKLRAWGIKTKSYRLPVASLVFCFVAVWHQVRSIHEKLSTGISKHGSGKNSGKMTLLDTLR